MIKDTTFVWNIDNELMNKFRSGKIANYYSDTFCNNTMVLCCPCTPDLQWEFRVFGLPYQVRNVLLNVTWIAYCDNVEIKYEKEKYELNHDQQTHIFGKIFFESILLQGMTALSFVVDVKVIEIKYNE